jgi:MinD-like ATPase involved in chromosome partitioning or flagellar assembly
MDEDAGSRPPRTLADVSHLFFSKASTGGEEPPGVDVRPEVNGGAGALASNAPSADAPEAPSAEPARTRVFVVTGGDDAPGKSTVAVNLAAAFLPFGRVAVFDADPRVPNARYFLGLPSWHYLSPLTGNGAAPSIMTEAGVVVCDWSGDETDGAPGENGVFYTDVPESGREPLDFAVVDVPASRGDLLTRLAGCASMYVVAARPGRRGFEHAFVALRAIRSGCGARVAALVVNGAADYDHASAFHAKLKTAAERLLSMDVRLMGAVTTEPGLGAEQRERGAIVTSRPDASTALALRRIASNALQFTRSDGRAGE